MDGKPAPRICILGSYSGRNAGDAAILASIMLALSEELGELSAQRMQRRGIELLLSERVNLVTRRGVGLKSGETVEGGTVVEGKVGKAIQFSARKKGANSTQKPGDSLVDPKWTQDVPIYVRAMVLAGPNLFIVGPPDIIDEESTFQKLTESDPEVQKLLSQQDAALDGDDGALLLAVNTASGEVESRLKLDTLPAWDAMAGADGKLFLSTLDGSVICFGN